MEPQIKNGSIVWVHKQEYVENGEIAIVMHNVEATCKKFYRYENHVELHSINEKYAPIVVLNGELKILGKVIN